MDYEEDVYNQIFQALKHPIRRRILKMLENKNHTYTSILNNLSIESGLLNYHLENLGSLISKSTEGQYTISEFGKAALGLTNKIEEPIQTTKNIYQILGFKTNLTQILSSIIVILTLTNLASLYHISSMETNNIVEWSDLDVLVSSTFNNTVGEKITFWAYLKNDRNYEVRVAPKLRYTITEYYEDKAGFRYNITSCIVSGTPASEYLTIPPNSKIEVFRYTTTIIRTGYLVVNVSGIFGCTVEITG